MLRQMKKAAIGTGFIPDKSIVVSSPADVTSNPRHGDSMQEEEGNLTPTL